MAASTANSRPSVAPKYAIPSTTAAEDSTFALVRSCQTMCPFARASPVTVPSFELTMSSGPAIAGVDGLAPPPRRRQSTRPVFASIAQVSPLNVFTYSTPSQ